MHQLFEMTRHLIEVYGYHAMFWLTAAEQVIFPLPVDGFLSIGTSVGLNVHWVLVLVALGTLLGSLTGYYLGKWLGHPFAEWLFGKKRVAHGEAFIKKWGMWGLIIAGLTPLPFKVMTWTSGLFEMPLKKYITGVMIGRLPRYFLFVYFGSALFETQFFTSPELSAAILGALQGATEFLPISSSGHLVIVEHFLHLPADIAAMDLEFFDIFLHGGSLLAIVLYFWKDWWKLLQEMAGILKKRRLSMNDTTTKLIVGTIPAIVAALLLKDVLTGPLRNTTSVAIAFAVTAIYFLIAEWKGKRANDQAPSTQQAVLMGVAQAFALVPGISRAGSTIATGVLSGLKREEAARFSFLLGGIAILAANTYAVLSLQSGVDLPPTNFVLVGFTASFFVSLGTVHLLMRFLKNHTLRAFSAYLLIMSGLLLTFF